MDIASERNLIWNNSQTMSLIYTLNCSSWVFLLPINACDSSNNCSFHYGFVGFSRVTIFLDDTYMEYYFWDFKWQSLPLKYVVFVLNMAWNHFMLVQCLSQLVLDHSNEFNHGVRYTYGKIFPTRELLSFWKCQLLRRLKNYFKGDLG